MKNWLTKTKNVLVEGFFGGLIFGVAYGAVGGLCICYLIVTISWIRTSLVFSIPYSRQLVDHRELAGIMLGCMIVGWLIFFIKEIGISLKKSLNGGIAR